MDLFESVWTGLAAFFIGLVVDAFKEKFLHLFDIQPDKFSMSTLATVLMVIGAFQFGTKWNSLFKPITKFRWFLDLKIKQGQKLYNKKRYESLVTRKIPVDPPVTSPDGTVIKEQMDYSQTDDFRRRYAKWTKQVYAGLMHAYGDKIKGEFTEDLPISSVYNSMSDMRNYLIKDIAYLIRKRFELKKDMLHVNFDPENLEDYESLKI